MYTSHQMCTIVLNKTCTCLGDHKSNCPVWTRFTCVVYMVVVLFVHQPQSRRYNVLLLSISCPSPGRSHQCSSRRVVGVRPEKVGGVKFWHRSQDPGLNRPGQQQQLTLQTAKRPKHSNRCFRACGI